MKITARLNHLNENGILKFKSIFRNIQINEI